MQRHSQGGRPGWHGLTERQKEYARVVAEGLSNPDIMERLSVTQSTAESYVRMLYNHYGIPPGGSHWDRRKALVEAIKDDLGLARICGEQD